MVTWAKIQSQTLNCLRSPGAPETDFFSLPLLVEWREDSPPKHYFCGFYNFHMIFHMLHFLLVLPSCRTFLQWYYSRPMFSQSALLEVWFFSVGNSRLELFSSTWVYFEVFCLLISLKVGVCICARLFNILESCLDRSDLCFNLYYCYYSILIFYQIKPLELAEDYQ